MTATTEPSDPFRQLRADARRNRQRILDAAIEVFAEEGIEAQIDDVAKRADLGVGTIYRHFPTKEALVIELMRQRFRDMTELARGALAEGGDPFESLAAMLRANGELCARDAGLQHALSGVGEEKWEHIEAELGELNQVVGEFVDRARAAGQLRADVNADDIAMLMCGVSSTMGHTAPGFDWRRHLELVIDMLRSHGS